MSDPAQHSQAWLRHAELVLILAVLSLIAPLAIDMYLPALPFIAQSLGATDAQAQLTLPTYFAGFAIGQAFYGPIADRFGRKPPLYFGLAVYICASIGCAHRKIVGCYCKSSTGTTCWRRPRFQSYRSTRK